MLLRLYNPILWRALDVRLALLTYLSVHCMLRLYNHILWRVLSVRLALLICALHTVETVQPHPVESPQCRTGLSYLCIAC